MNTTTLDALGQSIAYEEYKGNFELARQIAEQDLDQARRQSPSRHRSEALADALIWRGIVYNMQGEQKAALGCLEEAERLVPNNANLGLRAAGYGLLATHERFNSLPDGCGGGTIEISARWDGVQDMLQPHARWQDLLRRSTDPQALNEAWVYNFLCNLKLSRAILEGNRYAAPGASREQLLQTCLSTPVQLQQMAYSSGRYVVAAFADWCAADLCRRAGEAPTSQEFLDRAQTTYQYANDPAGVAACLMTRADGQCAPFSTPLAWNFALQDSSTEGSNLPVPLETDEFRAPSAGAIAEALTAYEQAERLFQQANAWRGMAAVRLRRGYLPCWRMTT